MLSIDDFKKSVYLCEMRDALIRQMNELTGKIQNQPVPLQDFKRDYYSSRIKRGDYALLWWLFTSVFGALTTLKLGEKLSDILHTEEEMGILISCLFTVVIIPALFIFLIHSLNKKKIMKFDYGYLLF